MTLTLYLIKLNYTSIFLENVFIVVVSCSEMLLFWDIFE